MYNLQVAKEEIDQVAKHTATLTEYVMSLSERVQAHETLDTKLNEFKTGLLAEIETKFAELERKLYGSESAPHGTSAVTDLGQKIASLFQGLATSKTTTEHHSEKHEDHHG